MNQYPICLKTAQPYTPDSITPMMVQIKFDQNWPTGLRDIGEKFPIIILWEITVLTKGRVTPDPV